MRILHVISSLDPSAGGPPVVVSRLAAAQVGLGHDVGILSYDFEGSGQRLPRLMDGVPKREDIRMTFLPAHDRLERLLGRHARNKAKDLLKQQDIIHLHGVWESINRVVASEARVLGVPYVVAPHGMLDPWSLAQRAWKKRLALAMAYRRMLDNAAFLHVLNDDEATLLAPLKLRAPARVIPNGIFPEEIPRDLARGRFRERFGIPNDRRIVLFLGRLHHKKGLDYLAPAFVELNRLVPEAHLVVAGPDGGEQAAFADQVAQLRIEERVSIVGPLYGREKYEAILDAACFCLPSRQEGFSMAILEALACSTPAVVSRACHFPEVAEGAGAVVELNPPAIAAALADILHDPEQARRMGEVGRQLVLEKFTWPVIARETLKNYGDCSASES